MSLRVRKVHWRGFAGDQADEALFGSQDGLVDGFAFEAFSGIKLQRSVYAQHVDRAHLGNHVDGDEHHHLVEAILCADRLRHDFAEPAQQHAWTAERATHERDPLATASAAASLRPNRVRIATRIRYLRSLARQAI